MPWKASDVQPKRIAEMGKEGEVASPVLSCSEMIRLVRLLTLSITITYSLSFFCIHRQLR